MSFPRREHKGVTAKESRSTGEDRNFVKTKDEVVALTEEAKHAAMAAILVCVSLYLFIVETSLSKKLGSERLS
ncbi:hypothetical protein L1049_023042 [Liquidambar formosana]|uniref:Uncharacterized protein n=1 Tax=Liquidambar formosana TaxID=63359 RepID=A0AAP0RFH0_LIQFO